MRSDPAPETAHWGGPRVQRHRGDRRGVEPLSVGLPPFITQSARAWLRSVPLVGAPADGEHLAWAGEPSPWLAVSIGGGLGDAVRTWAVARAAVRSGRCRWLLPVNAWREAGPARAAAEGWIDLLSQGKRPDKPPRDRRILLRAHEAFTEPLGPMAGAYCEALGLPVEAMAGPCLDVRPVELAAVREALTAAGWDGSAPVVAVQADEHPGDPGPIIDPEARRSIWGRLLKVYWPSLALAEPLAAGGAFPVLVGRRSPGTDAAGLQRVPGLDLRDAPLPRTLAALALADLAVASCSGPAHLAQAVGTPLLALYGPTDPDVHLWTLGAVALVSRRCELRPCGRDSSDGCPIGGPLGRLQPCLDPRALVPRGACMDMAPGDVAAAAFWLLAHRGGPVPRVLVAGELPADGRDGG